MHVMLGGEEEEEGAEEERGELCTHDVCVMSHDDAS